MTTVIRILINGAEHTIPVGDQALTVSGLLTHLALTARRVAVERNGDIVPKAAHDVQELSDGDRLEVVTFVGGG